MYIGNYRPSSLTQVQPVQDLSGIKVGQLVAVFNEDKETEPWIGKLEDIFEDNVTVVWMEGGYTKKWSTAKITDPANRRRKVEWKDTISKSSIILYAFELTAIQEVLEKPLSSTCKKRMKRNARTWTT